MNRSLSCDHLSLKRALALIGFVVINSLLWVQDADARRLGGGGSIGRQSSTVTQRAPTTPAQSTNAAAQKPAPAAPAAPAAPQGNRWLGPIAGLAAGLGIAALLSHFGMGGAFGEGLSSILMIGLLVFAGLFIWRMLRARGSVQAVPNLQPAYPSAVEPALDKPAQPAGFVSVANATVGTPAAPWGVPADFDVAAFVRSAKVNFIRLQAAWDAKNLADIREFTTPEMFAEVKMQIAESTGSNETDVVKLEADLLGIDSTEADYLASVRFTGSLRESKAAEAEPFEEIWNLAKPKDGKSGWLLAGIQQVH
jgi:predicted lipid-binding transport protein (Tim44 family)